jgi:hypothetical protein
MNMLTIAAICRLARASEGVVRDAIARGLVRVAWRDRQLHIEASSGRLWAEGYRPIAPVRKPPKLAARRSYDLDPLPASRDREVRAIQVANVDDFALDADTPVQPYVRKCPLGPLIRPASPGERLWTITELEAAAKCSRNVIINAIKNGGLAITALPEATRPYRIPNESAEEFLRQLADRRERIRQRKMGRSL